MYRLHKREMGTPEAIDQLLRAWNLRRGDVSYGGLKDTHAVTSQYVTIRRGPRRSFESQRWSIEPLGAVPRPFTPHDIQGNRFKLVLRSMSTDEIALAQNGLSALKSAGLPNYFDDQRFGSVGESKEFIAGAWVKGDYERAIWLTFADPNRFDRSQEKEQKRLLREHWGDWKTCKQVLEKSHRRSIITFLDDRPGDFRGAWGRVRQDMRSLYVAALQSHLWNCLMGEWLKNALPLEAISNVRLKLGDAPFPAGPDCGELLQPLRDVELPLPSARLKLPTGPVQELVDSTLARLGWTMRELRIKYPRDSFFSKGWRRALVQPADLRWSVDADELDPGRSRLSLSFTLPRGSYATILVKRITVVAAEEAEPELEDEFKGD